MISLILKKHDPCWVVIVNPRDRFIKSMKNLVTPVSYRKFDTELQKWILHYSKLKPVIDLAKNFYDRVDYRELPTNWQMVAAGAPASPRDRVGGTLWNEPCTDHKTLYVTPDAPVEVIKAAYKALAAIHHPDVGGDEEEFKKITQAYQKIKETKKFN